MVKGTDKNDIDHQVFEHRAGEGQSLGMEADGQVEGNSVTPQGAVGVRHWQASFIDNPSLHDRGNIFFAAVEMTRMPMIVTDARQPDNPIVFANGAFFDLTGYSEEEVYGRNCRLLQGPDTDPATVKQVREAVAQERAVAVDILNYKKGGRPFWNALFIGPVFDQSGELLYFFASQMDITEQRMSEQTFLQAQKLEALGQLTAGLAHDFNNLLQVVSGNIELAQRLIDGSNPVQSALQRALQATAKGARLTQQLLTFARKQHLEPRRINLNSIIVEFSEMLVRTLGDKVELSLDLRPGLPTCLLDQTHLEMALLNVLINARDALPEGGKVTVGTAILNDADVLREHGLAAGTYVVMCVTDEGSGMSPEVLRRATEPFFTTKGPGTGLGLAMVHGFVQQSRGRLDITSAVGEGTVVRMIFPAENGIPATLPVPERMGAQSRILVVEDNEDVRTLAVEVLGNAGYQVLSAQSGEEALKLLGDEQQVDMLFTDVIMPGGMNGIQLAESARAMRPGLPVLVTTGYMEELERKPGQEWLSILPKPYKHADLIDRIRTTIAPG